jgi:hypothetical protein
MAWIDDDVTPLLESVPLASGARGTSPGRDGGGPTDLAQLQRPGEVATGHRQRLANDQVHPAAPSRLPRWPWGRHRSRQHGRRPVPPRAAWSSFGPHAIGTERFATVSSGTSFAQVAGAILGEQAWVEIPDKDEGAGSSPARPTTPGLSCGNARRWSRPVAVASARRAGTAVSERIPEFEVAEVRWEERRPRPGSRLAVSASPSSWLGWRFAVR